jgi:hypothetical protein
MAFISLTHNCCIYDSFILCLYSDFLSLIFLTVEVFLLVLHDVTAVESESKANSCGQPNQLCRWLAILHDFCTSVRLIAKVKLLKVI